MLYRPQLTTQERELIPDNIINRKRRQQIEEAERMRMLYWLENMPINRVELEDLFKEDLDQ